MQQRREAAALAPAAGIGAAVLCAQSVGKQSTVEQSGPRPTASQGLQQPRSRIITFATLNIFPEEHPLLVISNISYSDNLVTKLSHCLVPHYLLPLGHHTDEELHQLLLLRKVGIPSELLVPFTYICSV